MGDTVGKLVKTAKDATIGSVMGGSAGSVAGTAIGAKKALSGSGNQGAAPASDLHRALIGKEGVSLLRSYMAGKLTGGQKSIVNQFKKSANASLQQELAQAGLSKSSAAFGGKEAIDAQAAQITDGFLQQDFSNAMNLLGLNMDSYFQQAGINVEEMKATAERDAGFAQALGSLGGGIAQAMG